MAKYQKYAEYKDSGIDWMGDIPKEWMVSRLKYIFTIKKRIAGKLGLDVLSVTQRGIKIKDTESGDGQLSMDYSKYQLVYKGDFAMNHMDLLTGYVDISKYEGVTSPDYRVFTIEHQKEFYSRYYLYLLQMGYKQQLFFHLGQGSSHLGRWRLPTEAFNEVIYPVPTFLEQNQIANFLDHETTKIDHLIEKQQQLIELLKEKRQAVISHAVTKGLDPNVPMKDSGVEWLGEVPEHWTKSKLVSVADGTKGCFVNGPFGSDLLANELRDEGVPVVYIRDIKPTGYKRKSTVHVTEQKARQLEVCNVKVDDVIISKVGDPPGDACLYPKGEPDAIVTQDVIRIRVDRSRFNPKFIVYLLNSDFGRLVMDNISVEGTRKRVSLGDFKDTHFVFPSLEEQELIVENLNSACKSIDLIIAKAIHGIGLIQERRTALISAAVTGKIDVRDWQAPTVSEAETEFSA
ncbi:restriction endonuclease subunit S [Acinetobacter brisouii]|uniref:restriction endonuclease subunit S n=1 Tax=Acinetobacter brisouii TaxID=396323 RepID=UPI0035B22512